MLTEQVTPRLPSGRPLYGDAEHHPRNQLRRPEGVPFVT